MGCVKPICTHKNSGTKSGKPGVTVTEQGEVSESFSAVTENMAQDANSHLFSQSTGFNCSRKSVHVQVIFFRVFCYCKVNRFCDNDFRANNCSISQTFVIQYDKFNSQEVTERFRDVKTDRLNAAKPHIIFT